MLELNISQGLRFESHTGHRTKVIVTVTVRVRVEQGHYTDGFWDYRVRGTAICDAERPMRLSDGYQVHSSSMTLMFQTRHLWLLHYYVVAPI